MIVEKKESDFFPIFFIILKPYKVNSGAKAVEETTKQDWIVTCLLWYQLSLVMDYVFFL